MPKKPFVGPLKKCSVDGCDCLTDSITGLMCGKHEMRLRRYGDVNYITPEKVRRERSRAAQIASKPSIKNSYAKFHGRHEHRVVAEKMLGRPLAKGEIVHHIDGDRRNNDPSNLQVMTQSDHIKLHKEEMAKARKDKHGY